MPDYIPKMEIADYADLIDLPRPVSRRHPPMARADRAAQFSAYQALNGYGDMIRESDRPTDTRIDPDEDSLQQLNERLAILSRCIQSRPEVRITCFEQDARKDGGHYVTVCEAARRIDPARRLLLLCSGRAIALRDIASIEGAIFDTDAE